jgi:hypothetical protein
MRGRIALPKRCARNSNKTSRDFAKLLECARVPASLSKKPRYSDELTENNAAWILSSIYSPA